MTNVKRCGNVFGDSYPWAVIVFSEEDAIGAGVGDGPFVRLRFKKE